MYGIPQHIKISWQWIKNRLLTNGLLSLILLFSLVFGCSKGENAESNVVDENPKSESDIEILFIGNSHTYYNSGVPFHVGRFGENEDPPNTPHIGVSSFGGYSLTDHLGNATTIGKVNERDWEYIILQENTFVAANDGESTLEALNSFKELVSQKSTKIYLFMTWEYKGEPEMYQPIKKTYEDGAAEIGAEIVRVGEVWREIVRDSLSNIELYNEDGYHPGPQGTFLAAAMFYSKLFNKNPSDSPYQAGLETEVANYLKLKAN